MGAEIRPSRVEDLPEIKLRRGINPQGRIHSQGGGKSKNAKVKKKRGRAELG